MRKPVRIFLIIAALLGIIQTFWFITITYPLPPVTRIIKQLPVLNWPFHYLALFLAIISGITFLAILMYGLFASSSHSDLSFQSNKGKLNISRSSIEKLLKNHLKENLSLHNVDVKVKLLGRRRAAKTTISATSDQRMNLTEQGAQIKQLVMNQLHNDLGIPVKKVIVNLDPHVQGDGNAPRVV